MESIVRRKLMSIKERADELDLVVSSDPIRPGDTYLAERNDGPKLLTCNKVINNSLGEPSYVVPEENAYCYDVWECVKIVEEKK